MKSALVLVVSALIIFADACAYTHQARAASARCAAGCANYCATTNAWKNATACDEMCQAKRCPKPTEMIAVSQIGLELLA